MKDLRELDWRMFVDKYDQYTLAAFLRERGISKEFYNFAGVLLNQDPFYDWSLIENVIDQCAFSQKLEMVVGGMDQASWVIFLPSLHNHI